MRNTKRAVLAATVLLSLSLCACSEVSNREDFAAALKDKTEDQVLKYAGKPVEVHREDPSKVTWVYKARTFDVPTRKTDGETDVIFSPSSDATLHVTDVQFKN